VAARAGEWHRASARPLPARIVLEHALLACPLPWHETLPAKANRAERKSQLCPPGG